MIHSFSILTLAPITSIDASDWFHPENQYYLGRLIPDINPQYLWFVERARVGNHPRNYRHVDGTLIVLKRPTASTTKVTQQQMKQWLQQLDSDTYAQRQQADLQLRQIHPGNISLLKTLKPVGLEAIGRYKAILESLKKRPAAYSVLARGTVPRRTHSLVMHPDGKHWFAAKGNDRRA